MKKNLIRTGIYLFILLFASLSTGALTISGHVEFSGPVDVTLSGDASIVTVTDRSGNYSFTDLARYVYNYPVQGLYPAPGEYHQP